jgi:hypothetical protein
MFLTSCFIDQSDFIFYFIFGQSDWSMKQEVMNFLRNLSNCSGIVQRCSFKLGNELGNIFRNASIGTTVNIPYHTKPYSATSHTSWHTSHTITYCKIIPHTARHIRTRQHSTTQQTNNTLYDTRH